MPLWDALIEAGTPYGITPAGIWALDIARIEAGLIMLDVDYFSAHHALIEAQKSSPLRAQPRLDGEPRQRARSTAARALRRGAGARPGVGLRRHRGRLGLARGALRRARPAAAAADRRVARQRARLPRTARRSATRRAAAGRRCSRSTSRSRTSRAPHFAAGHAGRDRGHGRAPARAGRGASCAKLPFFDPERKKA